MPSLANLQFPKAIRFTHAEPSYRAEYDRIFRVPLFFDSHMNALLVDEAFLNMKLPRTNPYLSEILSARAEELLKSGDVENHEGPRREPFGSHPAHWRREHGHDRGQTNRQPSDAFPHFESGGRNLRTGFG